MYARVMASPRVPGARPSVRSDETNFTCPRSSAGVTVRAAEISAGVGRTSAADAAPGGTTSASARSRDRCTGSCLRGRSSRLDARAPRRAPAQNDRLDVQGGERRGRSDDVGRVELADPEVQRLELLADEPLVRLALDRGEHRLGLLADRDRRWEIREPLPLQLLLHPPRLGQRPAGERQGPSPGQVVELARLLRLADEPLRVALQGLPFLPLGLRHAPVLTAE